MKVGAFLVDLERIIEEVKRRRAKRVLLQAPDGMLSGIEELSDQIESATGATVIFSLDPCYGACDVATAQASTFGADLIVHLAHTPVSDIENAIFIECPHLIEVEKRLVDAIVARISGYKRVGLACSLQYIDAMKRIATVLSNAGFDVRVGRPASRYMKRGQVTGCDVSSAKTISRDVDIFLVVGSGMFHALGVSLYTGKRTFLADVVNSRVVDLEQERRRRLTLIVDVIERAKDASNFCIIVGTKSGQVRVREALRIRRELEEAGKRARLAYITELIPERLLYLRADAFVQTLCPRISIDDIEAFDRPLLSSEQVPLLLEKLTYWDVYPAPTN